MDFSSITNNLTAFIVGILYIASAVGAIIEFLKKLTSSWLPKVALSKTFTELVLPILPYVVGVVIFFVLKLLQQPHDMIQILLAASLSDSAYKILKKAFVIYEKKQDAELKE